MLTAQHTIIPGVPVVFSITRDGNSSLTNQKFLDFTVLFSEEVTGVDASDFVISSNGTLSAPSIVSVSGSGDLYTVTVNASEGEGVIRLDVVDDDSITNGDTPLGGQGLGGDGDFDEGPAYIVDRVAPDVTLSTTAPATINGAFDATLRFTERVIGVDASDIKVANGVASNLVAIDDKTYSLTVTPTTSGTVEVIVPAGIAQDAAGNLSTAADINDKAQSVTLFKAVLEGRQVVPAVNTNAKGTAVLSLNDSQTALNYLIDLDGLSLKPVQSNRTQLQDVDKIHFHYGATGTNSFHALNVFGLPREDDADLSVNYETGVLQGRWDGSDAVDPSTGKLWDINPMLDTKLLSDSLDELLAGEIYIQVHTIGNGSGEVRGQILPVLTRNYVAAPFGSKPSRIVFDSSNRQITNGNGDRDQMRGDQRNDVMRGRGGNDLMLGGKGDDVMRGGSGNDVARGGQGNDRLFGQGGNDRLNGNGGNDLLKGGRGRDQLRGMNGNDILVGQGGNDVLIGGAGSDTFVYNDATDGSDKIKDFVVGTDLIDISTIFSKSAYVANSPDIQFAQFIRVSQVGSNTEIRIDADGVGSSTDFITLAVLSNVVQTTVQASSFIVA
ncbi:MAG: CHRD domain-containing protein [Cyanobacteria bacterium P01_A01_bin.37]